jgi:hypothetical protein
MKLAITGVGVALVIGNLLATISCARRGYLMSINMISGLPGGAFHYG